MDLNSEWQQALDDAHEFFRHLHQFPELRWQEQNTAKAIRDKLTTLDIPWRVCAETGTVGILAANAKGQHIALRGDIDALPITETTGLEWQSQVDGCMHACGHDGHTTALMATASWLKRHESSLAGPVSLIFQPAEEGGHGAKKMIEGGALAGVDAIYGWHNWPAIEYGKAVCPEGPVMAANGGFTIRVLGAGGHASQPEACRDPIVASAAITLALQQIVSRRLAPQQASVVSVTSIDGKSANTVIPEVVTLNGSIRCADTLGRDEIAKQITAIAQATAQAYGVEAEVVIEQCYGATVNHAAESARWREALAVCYGDNWQCTQTAVPIMASEDFSYYLNEIPGAFALIGNRVGSRFAKPCHSSHYQFNQALIEDVMRMYCDLVGVETR